MPADPAVSLSNVARRAVEAHGGAQRWLASTRVDATISVTGLAFRLKMVRPVPRTQLRVATGRPFARLDPIDPAGRVGILEDGDARLEDRAGNVVATRPHAGSYFPGGRRMFYWDSLDLAYFAGHAMWNYFTFPRLLLRSDIDWREVGDFALEARFPKHLPTHSQVQRFHFDPATGLLCRHDCTLEAVGSWMRVSQIVDHYREFDGVPHFGLRSVFLRGRGGSPVRWPVLIVGRVHEWRLS